MRVFVTGATGFVGSALTTELIEAGHQVLGLARSDAGAQWLKEAGAGVQRGDMEDLKSLRDGVAEADAVIHTAFIHDFSKFKENCEIEKRAIEAMGDVLAGTEKPLIVTSGLALIAEGRLATENDPAVPVSEHYPRASEQTAAELAKRGVRTMVVRLPQVHNTEKQGFVSYTIRLAKEKGVSAYIGDGMNRWAAVHRFDAAHVYRLALEEGKPGARYHAIAEQDLTAREIAEAIGRGLKVPVVSVPAEKVPEHYGWLGAFAGLNLTASSEQTRRELDWKPTGPGLIADLDNMDYSRV